MRAPDKWESARFLALFLASSFSHFQTESTPAHLRVTLAVGLSLSIHRNIKHETV
jgi:hypothetical protein